MGDVFANGRSILHKGDGNTHISAPPDVCKVPTPGGPVPTPFVNSAQDSMLAQGSKKTNIEGNSIALSSSELSLSSGDEPGTLGGLISSKFKGKMTWSGSSTDVKVEGKGVVRFLDPTMHNGNTFNICFISKGGTGLAYGDDAKCPKCKKSGARHRVLETPEIKDDVGAIFQELGKRFKEQQPLIEEWLKLNKKRKRLQEKSLKEAKAASAKLQPQKDRKTVLIAQRKAKEAQLGGMKGQGVEGSALQLMEDELTRLDRERKQLENEIGAEEKEIKDKRDKENLLIKELDDRKDKINMELEGMGPVLRKDKNIKTYIKGYMVGACVCKCSSKMLTACSGEAPPGFKKAVSATAFTLVETFQISSGQQEVVDAAPNMTNWECAAPKLLQAGGAGGHKIKAMSERYYAPQKNAEGKSAKVKDLSHKRTDRKGTRVVTKDIYHGETAPSCSVCQKNIPEIVCENYKECP